MKDYSKGKIYCIRSFQTDMVYVGSTIQELSMRMVGHRKDYKSYLNGKKHYLSSYEILQYEDAYIELIKLYPCSCRIEIEMEEGKFIRSMDCVNKKIAGRTTAEYNKQYYQNNKAKILAGRTHKEYNQNNKSKRLEKFNCDCGGKYTRHHKSTHFKSKKHQKYLNEKI